MKSFQRAREAKAEGDVAGERAVLIVDDSQTFATSLGESFEQAGFDVAINDNFERALASACVRRPTLIVTELRLGPKSLFDVCHSFQALECPMAVATAYPSIATAVRTLQVGIAVYMAKPVTADMVLAAFDIGLPRRQPLVSVPWPSLDRTIWEYINQVRIEAGSLSEAARRMRLDRRSLRRMLAKHPPAR